MCGLNCKSCHELKGINKNITLRIVCGRLLWDQWGSLLALQFKLQHWAWIRHHSGCESIVSLVFPVCLDCMRHSMCSVVQPVLSSCMENLIAVIKVIYSSGNSLRRYMFQSTAAEDPLSTNRRRWQSRRRQCIWRLRLFLPEAAHFAWEFSFISTTVPEMLLTSFLSPPFVVANPSKQYLLFPHRTQRYPQPTIIHFKVRDALFNAHLWMHFFHKWQMTMLSEGISHQKAIQPNVGIESVGHTNGPPGIVFK